MDRRITNAIRWIMDECLPPIIRDNKYFMYPFFYFWFKGKNIPEIMSFKSRVFSMNKDEFIDFYQRRTSLAKDRITDLSESSIQFMIDRLDPSATTLIDVGCGNGYFLSRLKGTGLETWGCDVFDSAPFQHSRYVQGDIEDLPFEDNQFDIVTSHHTLEHVIDLEKSISELKRIARKQLMIVVPCQRYYYYTLDEHIRFFPYKELLESKIKLSKFECVKIKGDLVYIGKIDDRSL